MADSPDSDVIAINAKMTVLANPSSLHFVLNSLAASNSGSGTKLSRFGILIFGRLSRSSLPSAGRMPFRLRM